MRHVVMFSGGIGSWAAARRVREHFPEGSITALFADTGIEDGDLYRFLPEAAASVNAELVILKEGRTPWEVFRDVRFIGNSRVDPCSRILKREVLDKWRDQNLDQQADVLYVGVDWSEAHRFVRVKERLAPWRVEAPMCDEPLMSKPQMIETLANYGIKPPRLYGMGFVHNNCGGFCIKAGHAHFANLLRKMPERFAAHEEQERQLRTELGDVAILRSRKGGKSIPLSLRMFREQREAGETYDMFDLGGCGCFSGDEAITGKEEA